VAAAPPFEAAPSRLNRDTLKTARTHLQAAAHVAVVAPQEPAEAD
jgi:hypothetical protein